MNFIIIHGVYANPQSNWFPWLKNKLETNGHEVIIPKFPTPLNQNLESWLRVMNKFEDKVGKETILIGHSLGAAFILDYLEQANKKIKAAFLVSGFHRQLGSPYDEINKTFVDKDFDWEKIRKNCGKFFLFCSDNDQYISLDVSKELAKKLGAEINLIKNGSHLNKEAGFKEFPFLAEKLEITYPNSPTYESLR